jgi:hypothetical protein
MLSLQVDGSSSFEGCIPIGIRTVLRAPSDTARAWEAATKPGGNFLLLVLIPSTGTTPHRSGLSRELFDFGPNFSFFFGPESCPESIRNAVRLHPGIPWALTPIRSEPFEFVFRRFAIECLFHSAVIQR